MTDPGQGETAPFLFIIAGEPSGDALGAALIAALRERTEGRLRIEGIGGEEMAAQGLQSLVPLSDLAVVGVAEVLPRAPLILRRVRQRQFFPVRVPASGKDFHRLFARSLRAMPRMAAVTTERKTDQPKPRLAASCGFRPSIRLTRCIGRGMRFTCHRRYRARRYLARHFGPGPRM